MSPTLDKQRLEGPGFPRVSGDEPQNEVTEAMEMRFSPRERG